MAVVDPAPDVPGTAAESAGSTGRISATAAEIAAAREWIRTALTRRGLAALLDRPVAAIRSEVGKLIVVLVVTIIGLAIAFAVFFVNTADQLSGLAGRTHTWARLFADARNAGLVGVAVTILIFVLPAVRGTLVEWSRVGNTLPLMLSFVALFLLSGDSWSLAGFMPWWQMGTFVAVFSLVSLAVLYRQARRAVGTVLSQPLRIGDLGQVSQPLVVRMLSQAQVLAIPELGRRALINLRAVATVLLVRRILISAITVCAGLFVFGLVVISKAHTADLLHSRSAAVGGFTATFGIGTYQLFVSEALLKVSMLLSAIAAAFFVLASTDAGAEREQETLVTGFIRRSIALLACYRALPSPAASTGRTAAAGGCGALAGGQASTEPAAESER